MPAVLSIKILSDASKAGAGFDQVTSKSDRMGKALGKAALPAAAIGVAALAGAKKVIDAASEQQQAMGGLDTVFGKNADQVKAWADQSAQAVGLSKTEYGNLATLIGAQFKNAGVATDKIGSKTNDLITLGADLAATYGGSTKDAVDALSSAMKGEADPAERYGLSLSQTAVNAELAAKGQSKLTGKALTAAKSAAVVALATKGAGNAIGDFGREANTAAGQQQRQAAASADAAAKLGTVFLPIVAKGQALLAKLATTVADNAGKVQILAGVVLVIAAAVLIANAAISVYSTVQTVAAAATRVWSAAQKSLNLAFLTSPVFLIVVGVLLLVAAIVLAYRHSATFRAVVAAAFKAVQVAAGAVAKAVRVVFAAAFRAVSIYVRTYIRVVVAVVRGVIAVARAVGAAVRSALSAAFRAAQAVARAVVSAVKAYLRTVQAVARAVGTGVRTALSTAFHAAQAVASSVVGGIKTVIRSVTGVASSVGSRLRSALVGALHAVGSAARSIGGALSAPFRGVQGVVNGVIGAVQRLIGWLGRIKVPKINLPFGIGGEATPAGLLAAEGAVARPTARGVRAEALWAGSGPAGGSSTPAGPAVVITINGALDPSAVARQVRRLLVGETRRVGGVVIAGG